MDYNEVTSKMLCIHESLIGYREEWGTDKFLSILGGYLMEECMLNGMEREGFSNYLAIMERNFNQCMKVLGK
ncbi:MAG: hypothetical protein KGI54_09585 [Pseudomonadota bacterium]|nr:hypothetical protein [Pseudomonadota bacterium]